MKNKKMQKLKLLMTVMIIFIIVLLFNYNKGYGFQDYYDSIPDILTLRNADLNLPDKYDLRNVNEVNYMTPVKNQGSYGLCWAFSSTTSFESVLKKSGAVPTNFNEWFSPYQIDALLTPKVKNPNINYVTRREGDKIRKLGEGGAPDLGFRASTTAYSPVLYNHFNKEKYEEHYNNLLTNKFNSNEIYNEKNVDYFVSDYDILEKVNDIPLVNVIKYYVYNYGAVVVGTILPMDLFNDPSKEVYVDTSYVDPLKLDFKNNFGEHAMAIIGWDDSKNSWILQNSWGDQFSYLYMTYGSYGEYAGIKRITQKNWDNRYYGKNSSRDDYKALYEFEKIPSNDEKIHSIVGDFDAVGKYNFYISVDANDESYELVRSIDVKMKGRQTINLEEDNIILKNNKFKFKITYEGKTDYDSSFVNYFFTELYVFTNDANTSSEKKAYLYDLYDLTSKNQPLSIKFKSLNISDMSEIKIKIKNELNEDVTNKFILSDSYYSNNYGELTYKTNMESFPEKRTEYTIELILNNSVVSSKKFGISTIDDIFKSGNGTKEDPFIITTPEQLQTISSTEELYKFSYKLGANIDAKNISFSPIGTAIEPFTGTFDGNNYTISNLNISNPNKFIEVGMFSYIKNASIKNIKLLNPQVIINENNVYRVGIIAGSIENSNIKNIYIENGLIEININPGIMYIGMIGGEASSSNFSDIYSSGNINVNELDYSYVGGFVGQILKNNTNTETYIMNSEFSGKINYNVSSGCIGGIVGSNSEQNFKLQNLLFSGQMEGTCQGESLCTNVLFGYFIGGSDYKEIKNSIYYQINQNNINIIGNSTLKAERYENIYAIVDNDNNSNEHYINKNNEEFFNIEKYNLDFNNTWYMTDIGPKIKSITKDFINKDDSIGESNLYDIDYEKRVISNVKSNVGKLTKKEFEDGFIVLLGDIYTSDGQLITSNDAKIKTGMIVRKNNKDYTIVIKGDLNYDGNINAADIIYLRRYLIGVYTFDDYQLKASDVNDDGLIDIEDVTHLRRAIAGGYDDSCELLWRDIK